jgi:hypothetical protein
LFKDKLENLAQGFGLDFKLPEKMSQAALDAIKPPTDMQTSVNENTSEFVTGQKLEKQSEQIVESDYQVLWVSLICLLLIMFGAAYQLRFKPVDI